MKIVEPYARIISREANVENDDTLPFTWMEGVKMLRRVEQFARVSHRSEDKQTLNSWERFIRSVVLQHGDWSVTEHESVTVEMLVDRGITHEIVRHRIGSYTQESTRFVNYNKPGHEANFIVPGPWIEGLGWVPITDKQFDIWWKAMEFAEQSYKMLLEEGLAPQLARSVFPNGLSSKIEITYNLRSWRHFFIMRTSKQAHPQMKQVTVPLLREFQAKIPILYEDIVPEENQAEAMKKAR